MTAGQTRGVAGSIILWWVQFYTTGLSSASRERRLAQIRSDLWEHYSDRAGQGASPALIGLESLGRAVRGAAADLFWRFQMEEPSVQINIPLERMAGACLLLLIAAFMLSVNAAGYDPAVEGFDVELRRLASLADWQAGTYTALQVVAGLGMLGGAAMLCLALRRYSAATAALAGVALAAAGVLTLVSSGLYIASAELADEYVAATPEHGDVVLTTARAFVLVLRAIVPVTAFALAQGVYGFALITGRHKLVPSWLTVVAGGSAAAFGLAVVAGLLDSSEFPWLFLMIGMGLLLLWLLVAGGWLLLGGSGSAVDATGPARTDGATAGPTQPPTG